MLELARGKAPAHPGGVRFERGNALELAYDDDDFDAATVGFGVRNFSDLAAGAGRDGARGQAGRPRRDPRDHDAAEAAAVVVLQALVRPVVPLLGRFAGDPDAYTYLPSSVRRFPGPAARSAAMLYAAGLRDVRWMLTAGGIIALHVGTVA